MVLTQGSMTVSTAELNPGIENDIKSSSMEIDDDLISFSIPGFNSAVETVIDPWVSTISNFNGNQYGYDVDYDFGGNTFVYGGGGNNTPLKVSMYNSAGSLQWTFSG